MSWIDVVTPEAASPEVAPLFERAKGRSHSGRVSNLWQVLALDPGGLGSLQEHYHAVVDSPAPLTTAQVEMIAVVVSATNGCGYCVAHHGPRLARAIGEEMARSVARDYRETNLAARDRVLLDAAVALTCEPAERTQADIERQREYGFDDRAILKATEVAALYNLVNRMVSALGVELEPGLEPWSFGAQR